MKKIIMIFIGIILLGPIPLSGVVNPAQAEENNNMMNRAAPYLVTLKDSSGKVVGQARLENRNPGVVIYLNVKGLKPGLHGIHFHEKGICEAPDFKSAGDHFNPHHKEHGLKNPKGPHAGDMKNVFADQNGNVETSYIDNLVTLDDGKKNSLFDEDGSSLVIHADEDDQMTNPSGNSGARVVCGVIK